MIQHIVDDQGEAQSGDQRVFETSVKNPTKKETSMKTKPPIIVLILSVAVISGIATGFGIHKLNAKGSSSAEIANIKEGSPTDAIKVDDVYGSKNEEIFKDSAEGVVEAGGLDGEGTHKLLREGGISQTVYLTSSVVDLDKFVGARVKVWGETNTAQKAGWLMDVGRVKVLELNAKAPEGSKPTATPEPKSKSKASPTKAAKKPAEDTAGDE